MLQLFAHWRLTCSKSIRERLGDAKVTPIGSVNQRRSQRQSSPRNSSCIHTVDNGGIGGGAAPEEATPLRWTFFRLPQNDTGRNSVASVRQGSVDFGREAKPSHQGVRNGSPLDRRNSVDHLDQQKRWWRRPDRQAEPALHLHLPHSLCAMCLLDCLRAQVKTTGDLFRPQPVDDQPEDLMLPLPSDRPFARARAQACGARTVAPRTEDSGHRPHRSRRSPNGRPRAQERCGPLTPPVV